MLELTLNLAVILFVLIAFASFVDAIAGGGGLITVPSYLAVGVPANLVLGTNKLVSSAGTGLAVFKMLRHNKVDCRFVKYVVIASLCGSFFGAMLSHVLDEKRMVYLLLVIVPVMLTINFVKNKRHAQHKDHYLEAKKQLIRGIMLCLVVGGYDGFFGPGTGTFLYLGLTYFVFFSVKQATVYARIVNFASNVSALSYFLAIGAIDWKVVTIALPAALIGAWAGSHLVVKGSDKWISWMVVFVLLLLLAKSVYSVILMN